MSQVLFADEYFRRKIVISFEAPPMTVELRNEILSDILSSFLELSPTLDECEPTWKRLIQEHRGKKWPTAFDLVKALRSIRDEISPYSASSPPTKNKPSGDDGWVPLTSIEKIHGAAFMRMLLHYGKANKVSSLIGLSGSALTERALEEGFAR